MPSQSGNMCIVPEKNKALAELTRALWVRHGAGVQFGGRILMARNALVKCPACMTGPTRREQMGMPPIPHVRKAGQPVEGPQKILLRCPTP